MNLLKKITEFNAEQQQLSEDKDFVSDINAVNLYGVPIHSHLILLLSFAFIVIALLWAGFATLDEVTRGSGKIIPSSHIQIVQNLEGGILSKILVKEGDQVVKGQELLQLDDVRFASSFNETKLKYYELLANNARLTAETTDQPLAIPQEVVDNAPELADHAEQLYRSRLSELEASTSVLSQQVRQKEQELVELKSKQEQLSRSYQLLQKEVQMSEPLVANGALSEVEMLRLRRSANDLLGELDSAKLSIPRIQAYLSENKSKLAEMKIRFRTEALKELNETKAELDRTKASTLALEDRVTRTRILSPVNGTIKQLKISTIGGVIQPGMDLIEIVPIDDTLLVEAQIRPADIAFLHPGQDAMVKLTAYDFSIYGGLKAKLEHISADTIITRRTKKAIT